MEDQPGLRPIAVGRNSVGKTSTAPLPSIFRIKTQFWWTVQLDTSYGAAREQILWCYTLAGMYKEALAGYEHGHDFDVSAAYFYAVSGNRNQALRIIAGVRRVYADTFSDPYALAIPYAGLRQKDRAFELLNQAYEEHSPSMPQMKIEPFFDNLRSDPRFQELVRRVGLPE